MRFNTSLSGGGLPIRSVLLPGRLWGHRSVPTQDEEGQRLGRSGSMNSSVVANTLQCLFDYIMSCIFLRHGVIRFLNCPFFF